MQPAPVPVPTQPPVGFEIFFACYVQPGVTHYMNVRHVVKGNPQFNSCTQESCKIRVQAQGL